MTFSVVEGMPALSFDMVGTFALALLVLLVGYFLREKIAFFSKVCIPAPVVGGITFALLVWLLYGTKLMNVELDTSLQSPFMIFFFTTVGLGASFNLLKKGGKLLIIYWLLCGILGWTQNLIGVGMSKVVGIKPMFGLMTGAISLTGGHGAAASFGGSAEAAGFEGALVAAVAAATFGVVTGGLIGGPAARKLIEKNHLKPSEDNFISADEAEKEEKEEITSRLIFQFLALVGVCMTCGGIVGKIFSGFLSISLPGYVGAMFVAVILRNINEKVHFMTLNLKMVDDFGDIALGIFLSMAIMSTKLWQLAELALPLLIILMVQLAFTFVYIYFLSFRLLGRDFDAAVMCGGMMGHALGATPNAMANMGAITEKYGYSRRAYLIVPIVGAFLIDAITMPGIVMFYNMCL